MNTLLAAVLTLFIAIPSQAMPEEEFSKFNEEIESSKPRKNQNSVSGIELLGITSEDQLDRYEKIENKLRKLHSEPKYSDIKNLTDAEVSAELERYIGRTDTWRRESAIAKAVRNLNPFRKKLGVQDEKLNLSYLHSRKTETSLQQYVTAATQSNHPEIREMIATIQGDKRLVLKSFMNTAKYDLRSLLHFFRTIEYGDTGLETKKFNEYTLAFENMAYDIKRAYIRASALNMPLILEFESSSLMKQSPLTKLLFNTIIRDTSRVLKVESTPSGGRIVSIHPFYAKSIVEGIDLFTDQFSKKVKSLRSRVFTDPDAKQRLVDLLRSAEGFSGVLYTDEKIKELELSAKRAIPAKTCTRLFN